jgi:hypothetical protein
MKFIIIYFSFMALISLPSLMRANAFLLATPVPVKVVLDTQLDSIVEKAPEQMSFLEEAVPKKKGPKNKATSKPISKRT